MSEDIQAGPPPVPPRSGPSGGSGPLCPYCGAKRITAARAPCWLCEEMLPGTDSPISGGPVRGREDNPAFMIIGVLIILLTTGLAGEAPGLLLVLALAATPALIRAVVVSGRARDAGVPLSGGEKVGAFLGAFGSVVLVGAAAGVAFFATCFAVCLGALSVSGPSAGNAILPISIFAGIAPGIFVFVWLIRKVWTRRRV